MYPIYPNQPSLLFKGRSCNPLCKLLAGLFIMWLIPIQGFSQSLSREDKLATICEPGYEPEFFVIRKDLNITREQFVKDYLHVLDLVPNSEMRQFRQETNDIGVTMTRYQQYVNNIKVKGGDMVVNEQHGRVKYINGRYMTKAAINQEVNISEEQGLQMALQQIKSTNYLWLNPEAEANFKKLKKSETATLYPHGELCYVPERGKNEAGVFRLVWKYLINVTPAIESFEVHIHAGTGEFVNKIPLTYDCSGGTSTTIWNGARTIFTQLNAGSYRSLGDCNSAQVHTMNGNGNDNGVGATFYTDADNAWPNTTLGNYIAQTHWGVKETRDYYAVVHGREGYDDAGHDFVSYINPGFTGNAYWTYATEAASFGGSSTGTSPYCNIDVCGHEHTHGMVHFTSDLVYQDEPGALNESFADCLGEAVEERTLGPTNWIHRHEISGGNRSLIDPNDFSDPDTYNGTFWYTGAGDNGGVHTNSGVQNHWFYLLSEGGSGTNDNGNAFTVTGITIDKARLIAYDCMVALSTNSQYSNARSTSIQKAKDRYGDCSLEAEMTTRAWYAVGVGSNWVAPTPLTISVTTTASYVCPGESVTLTAFGASTYVWSPGGSGNPKVFTPSSTTTYTVIGTNAEDCTGSRVVTVNVNPNPTVTPKIDDNEICVGQSTTLRADSNRTSRELITLLTGTNGFAGNVFDVHAYNNITITDFKMNIVTGDSAEIYYNPGGYGNANVTTTTGWTKLGATVPITAAGAGNLTTIPTTVNLTIPAGSTYGIMVVCNGSNDYSNGTLVGSIEESNSDLYITEGHGGSGFGGVFNFTNAPRIFNGSIVYRVNYTNYSWASATTLSSATVANPIATPTSSTTYTLTATDGNGCTATGTVKSFVYPKPTVNTTTASPTVICSGNTSQLNVTGSVFSSAQSLLTTLDDNNGLNGNMFDVTAINPIIITNIRMHITSGDSAQVWYKAGGYGGTNVNSSTGWTKLGNTVAITPAGAGALTLIPTSSNLSIPAGSTYGLAVVVNGSNRYTNGTAVGNLIAENADLQIFEGHGGSGFNGAFSFNVSPRIFNGQIDYTVTNSIATYNWSPNNGTLSSTSIQNPVADPRVTTNYRAILIDIHGCRDTGFVKVFVEPKPMVQVNVNPVGICPGDSAQLSTTVDITESDSLFTTVDDNNGFGPNGGVAFDITTSTKPITITDFKMNIDTGATQAKVFYKIGGYGGANVTSGTGWVQLGATVAITPAGQGILTRIPTTSNLTIPASSTYGFIVVTDGSVNYTTGTAVGNVFASNPDFSIKEGHGGSGFTTATFNFINSPRVFNGEIIYTVANTVSSYSWSPNTNMNNSSISTPKASPVNTTTYTVTVSDINGCSGTAVAGVVVDPLPQLGTATASPSSLCFPSSVDLTYTQPAGTGCFGAYQSGFAGTYAPANWTLNLVNSNGTVNTAGAPGSIIITSSDGLIASGQTNYSIPITCNGILSFNWSYTTSDGVNFDYPRYSTNGTTWFIFPGYLSTLGEPKQQTGTFTLPVTAGTTFYLQAYSLDNIGGAATITLSNFKAPYQTTASQSVVWFSAASGGSNLGNGNPQNHAPSSTGTFTYYAQVSSSATGCTHTTRVATNAVVVNPIPNVTANASPSTICQGSSTTLTASNASSYTWQPGGLTGSSVVVSPASTTTYTVTGTSAQGCSKTSTVTVVVNSAPAVTGSASPGIVCPGGAVTLTGTNAGATFNWQPGNLISASGVGIVVNPTAQTTYTVTATYGNGCTRTATFIILMHPTPTVTTSVAPSATFCAGQSATITASGASSYVWQPGGGVGANLIVTLANTYTVTGTNAQGCTGTATRVITVNPAPGVGTTATQTTICQGSSTTLNGTGATSYTWEPGGLSGTSVVVSPASTTTYTVTGTNANGCTATATRTITVNSAPAVTGSAVPGIVCPGGAVTLTGTNAGATFNWQPGNLNSASGVGVVVNPVAQTTYTVTATYGNGCTRTTTFVILMHPTPTVTTSVAPSATFCAGQSATITASGASSYVWQPGGGVGANLIVTLANTYTVTGTNAQGCTGTATRVITVNSLPTVGTTTTNAIICQGQSTSISGTGATSYVWNPGGLSGTTINVSPASTTTYTVIGTNANGCTATATRTITVNTPPSVSTTTPNASIPCGGSTTINASGASTYSWQPGGMTGSSVNVSPLVTTTYTVTGTAANGCTATATRTITVAPCGTTVNVKVFIQGYYTGGSTMGAVMLNQGIPGATATQTDTITIQLRNSTAPYGIAATQKRILNTDGNSTGNFTITGSYYLVVKHRNGLETWSANPVTLSGGTLSYNFSNLASKAFGSNQVNMEPGVFAIYSGDVFTDENIDLTDLGLIETDIVNFASGYFATDINGDGNVDIVDAPIAETNVTNFIFSIHP